MTSFGTSAAKGWLIAAVVLAALLFVRCYHPVGGANVGLDSSWSLGIAEAAAEHFVFGRDIVFTFGPLGYLIVDASLFADVVQRDIFQAAIALSIALLAAWHFLVARTPLQRVAFATLILIVAELRPSEDALTNLVLLLAWTSPPFRRQVIAQPWSVALGLFSGFISLTKFTTGIAGSVGGMLILGRNPRSLALFAVAFSVFGFSIPAAASYGPSGTAILSSAAFSSALWYAISPSIASRRAFLVGAFCALALCISDSTLAYLRGSLNISSGYSAAMSIVGLSWELGVALALAAILSVLLIGSRKALTTGVALALGAALFLSFKEGFVRQDGHVMAFFTECVTIGTIAVAAAPSIPVMNSAILATAISLLVTQVTLWNISPMLPPIANALDPRLVLKQSVRALSQPANAEDFRLAFDTSLAPDRLGPATLNGLREGTVDVLPSESAVVFANGLTWRPEPVFQSYAAYTPDLDRANSTSVVQRGADHILYAWQSIDGRYPLWDAPAAFREVACRYRLDERYTQPVHTISGQPFLVLEKGPERCSALSEQAVDASWQVPFSVPSETESLTFAAIHIRYSPLGRIVDSFYRIPPIYLKIEGLTGRTDYLRLAGEVASDGILVNPLPRDLGEFASLLAGEAPDEPSRITLETESPWLFEPNPKVTFETFAYH